MTIIAIAVVFFFAVVNAHAFLTTTTTNNRMGSMTLRSFDDATIQKLEEIRERYARLSNVESDDAKAQLAGIQDVAEKYNTYKEIRSMMTKLRTMWKSESSEKRKSKQLKGFLDLYQGRLEVEEIIKEKLGLPYIKNVRSVQEVETLKSLDAEIAALQKKLEAVEIKVPEGKSTREERFFELA